MDKCKFDLLSYGGDDEPLASGFIKINGKQLTTNKGRGITLVKVTRECGVAEIKHFDTHRSFQEGVDMRDYLVSLPKNTRIAGIAYDEYINKLRDARSTLTDLGIDLTKSGWRTGLCFTLIKGDPQLTRQKHSDGGKGPAALLTSMKIS